MMKKRVFMLAMAVGILLSFIASVLWAGTPTASKLDNVVAAYRKKYNVNATEGSTINIPVQVQIAVASSVQSGYTSGVANKVKFSVTSSEGAFESLTLDDSEKSITISDTDTFAFGTILRGTAKGSGTVTITGEALIGSTTLGTDTAVIVFTTEAGEDEVDSAFMLDGPNDDATKVAPSKVIGTTGDPDSETWDGKDPTFGTMGGNDKDKPKIATSKLVFTGTGYFATDKALKSGVPASFDIEIQGPGPLINVYVSAKDAKNLWPLSCDKKLNETDPPKDWDEDIPLTKENIKKWHIPFRVTVESLDTGASQDKNTKHTLTIAYNGAQVAYKGFPITVSAANDKTADSKGNQKPVTKTYKIDIKSNKQVPQWVTATGKIGDDLAKKNAQEISVALASGGTLGGTIYTVSADGPYYITTKGNKLGMSADETQPVLNKFGEVETPGYVKVYGTFDNGDKGTKGGTKEVKVAFTLDAVGSVKKTTFKPTVVGKVSPYFEAKNLVSSSDKDVSYAGLPKVNKTDYEGYYKVKTAEAGKVPSVKFAAKGSKTITYTLVSGGENLAQYGLSFDANKGQIIQLTNEDGKVTTKATMNSAYEYDPVEIIVSADNGTGHTATAKALVGVTGAKAKPYLGKDDKGKELKNLVIPQDSAAGTIIPIGSIVGKNVATKDSNDVNVQFRLADAKNKKEGKDDTGIGEDTYALKDLGLVFVPSSALGNSKDIYRNSGVLKVSGDLKATKGTKVNLILSNLGNEQKGSVNIVIVDKKPVIAGKSEIEVTPGGDAVTETYTLSAGAPTNGAKINWKLVKPDSKSKLSVSLSNPKDGKVTDYTQATLVVSGKADATSDKLTITAENADSKLKSEFEVTLTVKATGGGDDEEEEEPTDGNNDGLTIGETTALEDDIVTDEELTAELGEGEVTMGAERTVGMLTDAQAKVLDDGRFVIAAILPEISATADGQYGFEVDLAENVKAGAKLYWFAFPKDAPASEDDTIIDFFEINGTDTEVVPEDRIVVIYPWMRAGVTYGPVIAVKADDADSGEAVTEGELEGAAEKGTDK